MTTRIEFLGMAAHRTTNSEGKVILIDPFLEENPFSPIKVRDLERVDLILVTHLAFDHMSDAEEIAKKLGCPVCCGAEVRYWLAQRGVARCRAPTPNFSHESGSSRLFIRLVSAKKRLSTSELAMNRREGELS